MDQSHSRRNFLRGKLSTGTAPLRPPWSLPPERFPESCTRCGDCARACPTRIIEQGDGGYPVVNFRINECTFCGACADTCQTGALRRAPGQIPWAVRASIGEACLAGKQVECRICGEACEPRAIRFRPRPGGIAMPELDGDQCTGCGACVAPCPASAILVA